MVHVTPILYCPLERAQLVIGVGVRGVVVEKTPRAVLMIVVQRGALTGDVA